MTRNHAPILIVRSILPKVRGIVVNISICHGNTNKHIKLPSLADLIAQKAQALTA